MNNDNDTPLHFAAENGCTRVVELLLGKGASVEAKNKLGFTPLHLALLNNHLTVAELLLGEGSSTEGLNEPNHTPLQVAALSRFSSSSIDTRKITYAGKTPLQIAASKGNTSMVKLLLQKGARIEDIDEENNTPLDLAAQNGHTGTVELLLRKGALTKAMRESNNSPHHLTVPTCVLEGKASVKWQVKRVRFADCRHD